MDDSPQSFDSIAYGNGQFVIPGLQSYLLSVDGATWSEVMAPHQSWRVSFANGRFFATGTDAPAILSSTDAREWTAHAIDDRLELKAVAFGDGTFVAVGYGGLVLSSQDGVHWTDHSVSGVESLNDVCFADGQFVAVGRDGALLESRDGRNWTRHSTGVHLELYSVAFGEGHLVIVGSGGLILQSEPFVTLRGEWDVAETCFKLHVRGADLGRLQVQKSQDLRVWEEIPGLTNLQSLLGWSETEVGEQRFYRLYSE